MTSSNFQKNLLFVIFILTRDTLVTLDWNGIGMGRHLNCGGDFGAGRRCFGELSKKQDGDMDNLKVWGQSPQKAHFAGGLCVMPLPAMSAREGDEKAEAWLCVSALKR